MFDFMRNLISLYNYIVQWHLFLREI